MKNRFFSLLLPAVMAAGTLTAQNAPSNLDVSPLDVSYSPPGYPTLSLQKKADGPNARIIYSRPQLKGRTIFGDKEKYSTIWRMGANESTELELFKDAVIGGKKVAKGRYTLYALLKDSLNWTIIVNRATDGWGAYSYDSTKDVVRIPASVEAIAPQENLTIYFDNNNNLIVMWDKAKVTVPLTFTATTATKQSAAVKKSGSKKK